MQDFIIFPGDADFCKVPQCTTGRVFLLKFKNSSRKFFYWMQEPKEDKDEDICKKVNDLILNPRDSASLEGDLGGLQGLMGERARRGGCVWVWGVPVCTLMFVHTHVACELLDACSL